MNLFEKFKILEDSRNIRGKNLISNLSIIRKLYSI